MILAKDLKIGDKIYDVDTTRVREAFVRSLTLKDANTIIVEASGCSTMSGDPNDAKLKTSYDSVYYTDFEVALQVQAEKRRARAKHLFENMSKAAKDYHNFINLVGFDRINEYTKEDKKDGQG